MYIIFHIDCRQMALVVPQRLRLDYLRMQVHRDYLIAALDWPPTFPLLCSLLGETL